MDGLFLGRNGRSRGGAEETQAFSSFFSLGPTGHGWRVCMEDSRAIEVKSD